MRKPTWKSVSIVEHYFYSFPNNRGIMVVATMENQNENYSWEVFSTIERNGIPHIDKRFGNVAIGQIPTILDEFEVSLEKSNENLLPKL